MTAIGLPGPQGQALPAWRALLERERVQFLGLVLQVSLVALVIRVFHIESPAFYARLMPLVVASFVVHHLLPMAWRLRFFAAASMAGIMLVFGWVGGAWLIGVSLALIAICHLPIALRFRVAIIVALVLLLVVQRMEHVPAPWPAAIWPILGSMFMFRLIVYLHELKHQKEPVHWARTASYFFLLPNVCFPFFPVVDFATFRRTHYDRPALHIYQDGVRAMLRGVMQLLVYRAIYQYATISPAEVDTLGDLVRYLVANFGLYFRVSGQFHLIVGLLHLFGFRLPETHRFFFLSSSFTDLWRRINVYWKDFMQKVVYLPVYFRVKHRGETVALVISSSLVFFATWFFHSWQWFWILGSWLFSATDAAFWGILGVILVVASLREVKAGRTRVIGRPAWNWREASLHGLRAAATFSTLALLWGLWSSPTMDDFKALIVVEHVGISGVVAVVATFLAVMAAAMLMYQRMTTTLAPAQGTSSRLVMAGGAAPLMVLYVAGTPIARPVVGAPATEVARDLRAAGLNKNDAAELQRGYYERLQGVNKFNSRLWEVYSLQKRDSVAWPLFSEVGGLIDRPDALQTEVVPNLDIEFHGARLRTNAWGMRDRSYAKAKPAGTFRVALLGQSYVMGLGVGDGETFEQLLEERLNAGAVPGAPRYEWLNFAVPRYSLLQHALLLEGDRVTGFAPDLVVVVLNEVDLARLTSYIIEEQAQGREVPDSAIRARLREAQLGASATSTDRHRRLRPHEMANLESALLRIKALAEARGVPLAFAYVPTPVGNRDAAQAAELSRLIKSTGVPTLDVNDTFAVRDAMKYAVAEWDRHPNALGHRLIAEQLYRRLMEHPTLLRAGGEDR